MKIRFSLKQIVFSVCIVAVFFSLFTENRRLKRIAGSEVLRAWTFDSGFSVTPVDRMSAILCVGASVRGNCRVELVEQKADKSELVHSSWVIDPGNYCIAFSQSGDRFTCLLDGDVHSVAIDSSLHSDGVCYGFHSPNTEPHDVFETFKKTSSTRYLVRVKGNKAIKVGSDQKGQVRSEKIKVSEKNGVVHGELRDF